MRKSEIKHRIEESIKGFNHEFSEGIKIMESMATAELSEALPSKESFDLFVINVKRLNNLHVFNESWKVSQGIMVKADDNKSKCSACGGVIEKTTCTTHETVIESGHMDGCIYKPIIREECRIE